MPLVSDEESISNICSIYFPRRLPGPSPARERAAVILRRMARGTLLAGVVMLLALAPSAHAAQDYVGRTPPVVQGTEFTRPPASPAAPVVLAQEADDDGDRIPITGGDVAVLTLLGGTSIAAGTVLIRRARRHA